MSDRAIVSYTMDGSLDDCSHHRGGHTNTGGKKGLVRTGRVTTVSLLKDKLG